MTDHELLIDIQQRLAGLTYPSSYVTNGSWWTEGDNITPLIPYRVCAKANSNRIVLFLHSWSETMAQPVTNFTELAAMPNACIISPNFKGPNNTAQAMGSDASIDEIKAVIDRIKAITGLLIVDIAAWSGGTMAAMNFMGKYPGIVRKASLFLPIHDLALLHATTSASDLKADMVSVIGHVPVDINDAAYLARSPRSRLCNDIGNTKVFLNVGTLDTQAVKAHGEQAKAQIELNSPEATVVYKEWPIAHTISANERNEMIRQIS